MQEMSNLVWIDMQNRYYLIRTCQLDNRLHSEFIDSKAPLNAAELPYT